MWFRLYVSLFVIIVVPEINGFPSGTIEKEPQKRNTNTLRKHNYPFLRVKQNANSKEQAKLTFKRADLLAACKGAKGPRRKTCVTSFVRRTYPEYFKNDQEVPKDQTSVEEPKISNPDCQNIDHTTTAATVKQINSQPKKNLPALLVAPGEPKTIAEITQQEQKGDISNLQTNTQIPLSCGAEFFGFEPQTSSMMVGLTFDILCALCQEQGEPGCDGILCSNDGQGTTTV